MVPWGRPGVRRWGRAGRAHADARGCLASLGAGRGVQGRVTGVAPRGRGGVAAGLQGSGAWGARWRGMGSKVLGERTMRTCMWLRGGSGCVCVWERRGTEDCSLQHGEHTQRVRGRWLERGATLPQPRSHHQQQQQQHGPGQVPGQVHAPQGYGPASVAGHSCRTRQGQGGGGGAGAAPLHHWWCHGRGWADCPRPVDPCGRGTGGR